jgi:phosphonate transport system substrate-binding protein
MTSLRFVLPPSLGESKAGDLAARLQGYLTEHMGDSVTVYVAPDYAAIEDDLLFGSADVAWGPPFVCARLQAAGGRFLLHAVRSGASRYRAGMICRKAEEPDLTDVTGLRVAWVSPDSTAGYLLPRQWLRDRGIDADSAFTTVSFLGSYQAAVRAVMDDEADITAVFASVHDADKAHSGLDELSEEAREKLEIFAYTAERLNDGIVFAPDCERLVLEEVRDLLKNAHTSDAGREVLRSVFNADQLVPTETAAYNAMYETSDPNLAAPGGD